MSEPRPCDGRVGGRFGGKLSAVVINVDRATERMAHMRASLDQLGVPLVRQSAVTPDQLDEAARRHGVTREASLTQLEQACYLSHVKAWEIAAAHTGLTLILEDDVVFSADAEAALHLVVETSTADLIRVEAFSRVRPLLSRRPRAQANGFELRTLFGRSVGAAGYILSPQGARHLLTHGKAMRNAVDILLFHRNGVPGLRMQQVLPAIAVQSDQIVQLAPPAAPDWMEVAVTPFASQLQSQGRTRLDTDAGLRKLWASIRRKLRRQVRRHVPLSSMGPLQVGPKPEGTTPGHTTGERDASSSPDPLPQQESAAAPAGQEAP